MKYFIKYIDLKTKEIYELKYFDSFKSMFDTTRFVNKLLQENQLQLFMYDEYGIEYKINITKVLE